MASPFSDDLLDEVRLASVRGVGPMIRGRLIEALGSAGAALGAGGRELTAVRGVGQALVAAVGRAPTREAAAAMLAAAAERGIRVLTPGMAEYPPGLREIHDPPPVLYCRGEVLPADERAVAVVGTRRATRYGLRQTELLTRGLAAAGVTIVSGLARGVDGVAHRAAVEAGGRTLAVLAGGLSRIYPPEHEGLAEGVAARGALLAEAPPPMPPMSGSFPQRNRIVSGMSLAVLVIEAAERSGALITARHAAEQGRDVFALPGPIDSVASRGCHRLIQEGAKLVTSVEDVLEEVETLASLRSLSALAPRSRGGVASPPLAEPTPTAPAKEWSEPERTLLGAIRSEATGIDGLVEATGLPIERVLAGLSRLEAEGAIRRLSGATVRLA